MRVTTVDDRCRFCFDFVFDCFLLLAAADSLRVLKVGTFVWLKCVHLRLETKMIVLLVCEGPP